MFFDTALNSADTMLRNIYEAFVEAATKMWAYVRCLPRQKRPASGLVTRRFLIKTGCSLSYFLITRSSVCPWPFRILGI